MHDPMLYRLAQASYQERLAAARRAREQACWAPAPNILAQMRQRITGWLSGAGRRAAGGGLAARCDERAIG